MSAQRAQRNFHEGKQRQVGQDVVKLLSAADVENADVGIMPSNSPEVAPLALALQFLRAFTLDFPERLGPVRRQIVGQPYVHPNMEQHGYAPTLNRDVADTE